VSTRPIGRDGWDEELLINI